MSAEERSLSEVDRELAAVETLLDYEELQKYRAIKDRLNPEQKADYDARVRRQSAAVLNNIEGFRATLVGHLLDKRPAPSNEEARAMAAAAIRTVTNELRALNQASAPKRGNARPQTSGGKVAKRHKKVLRDPILGVTKAAIKRLARRGGAKRISATMFEKIREFLDKYVEEVAHDAVIYAQHARRKTVYPMDSVYALNRLGRKMYGFG